MSRTVRAAVLAAVALSVAARGAGSAAAPKTGVAVGAQYDTTHVYVAPGDMDAFVTSFAATFGGTPSKGTVTNILPVPSGTELRFVPSPAGALSVFAFQTPVPYPFGQERTGYLVTDMDQAIKAARAAGAEVIVEPFKDPIGMDAVIQWPGGLKMQLYWHFEAPSSKPLETIPDNRVYISGDRVDAFVRAFLIFAHGKVISEDRHADAGEIGRPGETYRRIRIESTFGKMQVMVTDGHLPWPFGRELTGYEVRDLATTLEKAKTAGARVVSAPFVAKDRTSAILEFPGGYIAEVHSLAP